MIEERALQLMSLSGFLDAWWRYQQQGYSKVESYDMLEREFEKYFGRTRFTSYKSFYQTVWFKEKRK